LSESAENQPGYDDSDETSKQRSKKQASKRRLSILYLQVSYEAAVSGERSVEGSKWSGQLRSYLVPIVASGVVLPMETCGASVGSCAKHNVQRLWISEAS
jgi:hypothetical protein